jgi:dihydroorotate dehydrogenase
MMVPLLYRLLRPLLFRLDPESAHGLSLRALQLLGALSPLAGLLRARNTPGTRPVPLFGLTFPNRVGLAAGYDKDGLAWRGLAALGFGHLELGTVTPRPQPGNPRPRIFRLPEDRSLVNRMGFPNRGAEALTPRLHRHRPAGLILGVNLGKQRETALAAAAADYELLMDRFAPVADYLAINVSSPNTPGLRDLQQARTLEPLLAGLARRRAELATRLQRRVPLLVKLSPDLDEGELERALQAVVAAGLDGVIATNTTTAREGLRSPSAIESGGLSGAALTARSTAVVSTIARLTAGKLPIVACGGVMSAADARAKLEAGASLVQLYTGLIYEGPGLPRRINLEV